LLLSVRPSVCLSVAYIANNSRTQRPSVPNFGRKVPTLDATSTPVSRSKGQRSGSPGPLMLIHIVRHIFRMAWPMASPTNFKLQMSRISHRRHNLQGERSRSQGHVISLSRVGPIAHKTKKNSHSITKICRRVHCTPVSRSKGQGHRSTNADTQYVPYLPNGKA